MFWLIEKQYIKWNANKLIVLAAEKYARDISEPHKIMHSIKWNAFGSNWTNDAVQ